MELTKTKQKAVAAIRKARERRYKLREIAEATGVSLGVICNIDKGGYPFSEAVAAKVVEGCKSLGRLS